MSTGRAKRPINAALMAAQLSAAKSRGRLVPSQIIAASAQPPAATLGHQLKHKNFLAALAGTIATAVVCGAAAAAAVALVGAAIAAAPFTMGGSIAAVVSIGVSVGVAMGTNAALGGRLTSGVTNAVEKIFTPNADDGPIISGASRTFIEGQAAARITDEIACTRHSPPPLIAQGSTNVFIEGLPAARKDDKSACGAPIGEGASRTFIGGGQFTDPNQTIAPEFSAAQRALLIGVEFIMPPGLGLVRGGIRAILKPRTIFAALNGKGLANHAKRYVTKAKDYWASPNKWERIKDSVTIKRKPPNAQSSLPSGKGVCNKDCPIDPVDPITGDVVDQATDIQLGQTLPLIIKRTYTSFYSPQSLGPNWLSTLDQCISLAFEATECLWHNDEGQSIHFGMPHQAKESVNTRHPGYVLRHYEQRSIFVLEHTPSGITQSFKRFGDKAYLMRTEDRRHNVIDWQRDDSGQLHTIQHSDGITLMCQYNDDSRLTTIARLTREDEAQALVQYDYHDGYLVQSNSRAKGVTQYSYNDQGLMDRWNDAQSTWAQYEYDDQGRCIKGYTSDGYYTGTLEYQEGVTLFTNAKGHVVEYHHDHRQLMTKKINPLGGTEIYDYNDHELLTHYTDPNGSVTEYVYNEEGYLTSITDPSGNTTAYEYNDQGQVTKATDALGHVWENHYDVYGQLKRSYDPQGGSTTLRYTRHGQLNYVINDNTQHQQQFVYDQQHRLQESKNPLGHQQRYAYNTHDQLTAHTDAAGHHTQLHYDEQDNLIQIDNAEGQSTLYQYDAERNLIASQDAAGHHTQSSYGAFDLLQSQTDANGHTYQYEYDKDSLKLKSVTNPEGQRYHYHYDAAERVIKTSDYSGIDTEYRYDQAGRCTAKINALGQLTQYAYDANSNLIEKITDEGNTTRYTYDALNRLLKVEGENSQHVFTYDSLGRLTQETHNGESIEHHYNIAGQRSKRILAPSPWTPDAQAYTTDYDYDAAGQLTSLKLPQTQAYQLSYDARGLNTKKKSAEGFQINQGYTALGLLKEQTAGHHLQTPLGDQAAIFQEHSQRKLIYDARQNPVSIQDKHWGETRFGYNANSQISDAQHPTHSEQFNYGSIQQITQKHSDIAQNNDGLSATHSSIRNDRGEQSYEYNGGRITEKRHSPTKSTTWIYDELGRVHQKIDKENGFRDKSTKYTWNSEDQLTKIITDDKQTWHYQYDAFGRRITKYNPHTKETIHTSWDGGVIAREVRLHPESKFQETQKSDIEYWHYQQNSFEPIAKQVEKKEAHTSKTKYSTYYTVTDHIGTPRELFTDNGDIAWRGYYGTWGQVQTDTTYTKQETDCNLRYAGQYFDKESGLHYNRFRYYDPTSSQYLSPDPIGLQGGLTPQSYVHNPNVWIDPLGLAKGDLCPPKSITRQDSHAPDFDTARKKAFENAGMTDPSKVIVTKVDPVTGTAVEFKGPNGAKVEFDSPHASPGPGHDKPHVGFRYGKGKERVRGNITYDGPQHPYRSPNKGEGIVNY